MSALKSIPFSNWRLKDRGRFGDPKLVAARQGCGQVEVFVYHEAICDLIDIARENEIDESLYTLARFVHDDPIGDIELWFRKRRMILEQLRVHGLVDFEGDISDPYQPMTLRLPLKTYAKWHLDGEGGAKSTAAKKKKRKSDGTFAPTQETPHEQGDSPQPPTTPHLEIVDTTTSTIPFPSLPFPSTDNQQTQSYEKLRANAGPPTAKPEPETKNRLGDGAFADWMHTVSVLLAETLSSDPAWLLEEIERSWRTWQSRTRGQSRPSGEDFLIAAKEFADRNDAGKLADVSNLLGYYISTVHGAAAKAQLKAKASPEDRAAQERLRQIAAADAELEAAWAAADTDPEGAAG